eukprot:TRINITY_DN32342_c0_g1_i1.p1 TRINITY_DN32342_c0_g1~~TRINITY_DN32342_c0_g1_i1.p1  ORF type:complete len:107 (+),score=11.35 TRINITY_DN32342_c0_g1_i1:279-599(+)
MPCQNLLTVTSGTADWLKANCTAFCYSSTGHMVFDIFDRHPGLLLGFGARAAAHLQAALARLVAAEAAAAGEHASIETTVSLMALSHQLPRATDRRGVHAEKMRLT